MTRFKVAKGWEKTMIGAMGFLSDLGRIIGPLLGPLGGLLGGPAGAALGSAAGAGIGIASTRSQDRSQSKMRRSLMEERTLANRERERAREEMEGKKKQLTDLRRTVGAGKRSLLSAWYDDGSLFGKQTIGV
jgi:hypothetical protein